MAKEKDTKNDKDSRSGPLDSNSSRDSQDAHHTQAQRMACDPALEPLLARGHL
jgi:hypothetical protein